MAGEYYPSHVSISNYFSMLLNFIYLYGFNAKEDLILSKHLQYTYFWSS